MYCVECLEVISRVNAVHTVKSRLKPHALIFGTEHYGGTPVSKDKPKALSAH